MSAPRITYVPRPDAIQEAELNALASVYRFTLDSRAMNTGGAENLKERDGLVEHEPWQIVQGEAGE